MMVEIEQLIRVHLKQLIPYSSARAEYGGEEGIFLDANENPYGNFNRYPDSCQTKLKKQIGKLKNVKTENIFLGNGSDEIIDLLFRIFCNPGSDKAMIFEPTFGMYETSARINDVEAIKIRLNESFQIDLDDIKLNRQIQSDSTKMVFICSPNNPTGNTIDPNKIKYLLGVYKGVVVIDEAYIDFSSLESWVPAIKDYPNLIVLQTLSKAWGMAGLRIGMAFAGAQVIHYLNKIKPAYNISTANQELALERLQDERTIRQQIEIILSEKDRVIEALSNSPVVEKIYPSEANFILIEVSNADKVYKALLRQGIIVRNRDKQVKNCLRITIGLPRENDLLINAFKHLTA